MNIDLHESPMIGLSEPVFTGVVTTPNPDYQDMVREFHETFGIEVSDRPQYGSAELQKLRLELIAEEFAELIKAYGQNDVAEIAEELVDLLYVTFGAAVSHGFDIRPIFEEKHRANMAKVGGHKSATGKWVKPEGYIPADITSIINEQKKAYDAKAAMIQADGIPWGLDEK